MLAWTFCFVITVFHWLREGESGIDQPREREVGRERKRDGRKRKKAREQSSPAWLSPNPRGTGEIASRRAGA
jgi:hypothetical protein